MANQLIMCILWYMLTLWTGDMVQLEEWDKTIKDFVWSGHETGKRPRVDYAPLLRSLEEGGLVLISIKAQTIAMVGKTVLWAVATGDHTLQWILRAKIVDLLERRWGRRDFS